MPHLIKTLSLSDHLRLLSKIWDSPVFFTICVAVQKKIKKLSYATSFNAWLVINLAWTKYHSRKDGGFTYLWDFLTNEEKSKGFFAQDYLGAAWTLDSKELSLDCHSM